MLGIATLTESHVISGAWVCEEKGKGQDPTATMKERQGFNNLGCSLDLLLNMKQKLGIAALVSTLQFGEVPV